MEGWSLFGMPNGSIIDLYSPEAAAGTCPWGLNDGVVFGFRVDDIEKASKELEAAGCELLGDFHFIEQLNYTWRHFRGPDGRVVRHQPAALTAPARAARGRRARRGVGRTERFR